MWYRHVVVRLGFFRNSNSMCNPSPGSLRSDYIASAGLYRGPASADGSWCPLSSLLTTRHLRAWWMSSLHWGKYVEGALRAYSMGIIKIMEQKQIAERSHSMMLGAIFVSSRAKKFADRQMFDRSNLQFCETSFRNFLISFRSTSQSIRCAARARPGSASQG